MVRIFGLCDGSCISQDGLINLNSIRIALESQSSFTVMGIVRGTLRESNLSRRMAVRVAATPPVTPPCAARGVDIPKLDF